MRNNKNVGFLLKHKSNDDKGLMRGDSRNDESKDDEEKQSEESNHDNRREEDQSCYQSWPASMLKHSSSLLCFALHLLTYLAVCPAHRVFLRFACVSCDVPLGGCGFPDQEV